MTPKLATSVRRRARYRCEYCHYPERLAELHFQFDHVIARKHRGTTSLNNLAWACFRCNSHKGPNLSGVDPQSGRIVRLFNPRDDFWPDHFVWNEARLLGLTAIGRVTIAVLCINRADAVLARTALLKEGVSFN